MPDCSCEKCVAACRHMPGWMTVTEAKAAIAAGKSHQLMIDWWCGKDANIYVLCPAAIGRGGRRAALTSELFPTFIASLFDSSAPQSCILLKGGKCEIHDSGFKPKQCRESMGCTGKGPHKREFIDEWGSSEGKDLIVFWASTINVDLKELIQEIEQEWR